MQKKYLAFGLLILALVVLYFFYPSSQKPDMPSAVAQTEEPEDRPEDIPMPSEGDPEEASSSSGGFLPTQMENSGRFESYQQQLKALSTCLNIKTSPFDANAEISLETLHEAISGELGAIVSRNKDWTVTDIRTPSNEMRRIFFKNTPDLDPQVLSSVKYYAFAADGSRKELPLSKEQSENPSETLLASLEADGQVIAKSNAWRVFYQNGFDLIATEKNGRIYSFELNRDDKAFRCQENAQGLLQCRCI